MELYLVQNRKESCHNDHIPFNFKGNGILVFSVYKTIPPWFLSSLLQKLHSLQDRSVLLSLIIHTKTLLLTRPFRLAFSPPFSCISFSFLTYKLNSGRFTQPYFRFFFSGFLAIFIVLWSNNNIQLTTNGSMTFISLCFYMYRHRQKKIIFKKQRA